ncbi:MAG: hypothetical protein JXR61_13620 [Prolixibacteraceae bacterium]|nr:hypothetical protein [Prolixibacteraceae bacterium]
MKRFAWYRFVTFILIVVPFIIFGWNIYTGIASFGFVILFFFLVKRNLQLSLKKRKLALSKQFVDDELLALNHTFSHFEDGKEFLDTDHFFSYDLDLFGEGSLFQFLNRTSTRGGTEKLAGWLIKPSLDKREIENKQAAVNELANMPEWRLNFRTEGKLFEETENMNREMKSWGKVTLNFEKGNVLKPVLYIIPALTLLAIIYYAISGSSFFVIITVLLQWGITFAFSKKVKQFFDFFGQKSELLSKYMKLLQLIENHKFEAQYLQKLRADVIQPELASHVFNRLKKLVKEFEYRQNILVGFVLNSLFLWDVSCVFRLWNWQNKQHEKINAWLNIITEFDALISLANFAQNNDEFTYPEIESEDFFLHAEGLGHPLLNPAKRVTNDLEINGWSQLIIITGANMAGKSTFLRTVGVNFILGRTGAPVCASKMKFTPVAIYTNMRTTDSLLHDESYFFAELKRIKGVLDRLQNGEKIFVILDEMLKGTNSVDKLNGSKELTRRLLKYHSVSLIATHDLKLSEMEKEYPHQIKNRCFEIRIENDEMVFDYKLSEGVTKTMNATFLMKKMGII